MLSVRINLSVSLGNTTKMNTTKGNTIVWGDVSCTLVMACRWMSRYSSKLCHSFTKRPFKDFVWNNHSQFINVKKLEKIYSKQTWLSIGMFAPVTELDSGKCDLLYSINDDNLFYAVTTQKVNIQTWDATQIKQHWKKRPCQHAWMVGICVLHLLCNPRKSHFNPWKFNWLGPIGLI